MTAQVQEHIISLWGGHFSNLPKPQFSLSQPPAPLVTLFSRRNLGLLSKSLNPKRTWDTFENFVGRMLTSSILFPILLEEQCLRLLKANQNDLSEDISRRFGSCLKGVIDSWNRQSFQKNQDLTNFTGEFLEWFAWFFTNLNDDFDDSLENFPELTI